jgi:hypothetical protein
LVRGYGHAEQRWNEYNNHRKDGSSSRTDQYDGEESEVSKRREALLVPVCIYVCVCLA